MKKPKLTPWFPADVKPVRKGFYDTRLKKGGHAMTWYWDGQRWSGVFDSSYACFIQNRGWRGLASDPKVAA